MMRLLVSKKKGGEGEAKIPMMEEMIMGRKLDVLLFPGRNP